VDQAQQCLRVRADNPLLHDSGFCEVRFACTVSCLIWSGPVRCASAAVVASYPGWMLTPGVIGEDLTGFFHAAQISTPIADALKVGLTEPSGRARQRLVKERFDQAPVTHEERLVGWVATDALATGRAVKAVMTPLELCSLVSAEASIASILPLLLDAGFIFTVGDQGFSGFIVRSDMDRHAVRSYLYMLVSGIEMLLAEVVKSAIPDDRIRARIREGELKDAYDQARADGQDTSPAEYLYLKDLVSLFDETGYVNNPSLWDSSSSQLLRKVAVFRNSVMHPVRSIAAGDNAATAALLPGWTAALADRLHLVIASMKTEI
jgi:hypothetical protein